MSSVSTEAGDTEITNLTENPPVKNLKPNPKPEAEGGDTKLETVPEVATEGRIRRKPDWDDPEFQRQLKLFGEQYEKSEGYDLDWDNLDFYFDTLKLEDGYNYDAKLSNRELVEMLIKRAIILENEECDSNLEFVKYVSANVQAVSGLLFFVTFWAKDHNSSNQEPQLFQAKVRKFGLEIEVLEFRLRPSQELL